MARNSNRSKVADLDALMPSLARVVLERGAITLSQLIKLGVPKEQHQAAAVRLHEEGFETTAKTIRQPIRQQLLRRLEERGQLPLKRLDKLVVGCTAREVNVLVDELVTNGTARRVLRTKAEWIVTAGTDVLSDDEVNALHRAVSEWTTQTKKAIAAKKRSLTFWRDDVASLVDDLMSLKNKSVQSSEAADAQRLLRIIAENLEPSVGLAFVPAVVEKSQMSVTRAQTLLLGLARRGHVELRPDTGAVRFSDAELNAAPAGPDGSRLLWARPIEEAV